MKKMNNKGYVLIEIILAFVITFGIIYFMMDMVINIKNKNDDLLVSSLVEVDGTIITNKLMSYLVDTEIKNKNDAETFCNDISVDSTVNAVKYKDEVIHYVSDSVNVSRVEHSVDNDTIRIVIPIELKQVNRDFDVVINYNYRYNIKNTIDSYWCNNHQDDEEPYSFVYEGDCEVSIDEETLDWKIKFLGKNGYGTYNFTPYFDSDIDAFLVGGGGGGGSGRVTDDNTGVDFGSGGGGGGGGYTKTGKGISVIGGTNYTITIGSGGSGTSSDYEKGGTGGTTSAFNFSAAGGNGGNYASSRTSRGSGGSGGNAGGTGGYGGDAGGAGGSYGRGATCEFGEGTSSGCTNGTSYAYAGGGGGGRGWNGNGPGSNGAGGTGGGGAGLSAGNANKGGGGGGGDAGNGKAGGSGIVVIRNAR